jgi:hypothetical protein
VIGTIVIVNCKIIGTVSKIITVFHSDNFILLTHPIYYIVFMQYFKHTEFKHIYIYVAVCYKTMSFSSKTHRSITVSSSTQISSPH